MPPYICLTWDRRDDGANRRADSITTRIETATPCWKAQLRKPSVRLYAPQKRPDSPNVLRLRNGAGIILGTLFSASMQPEASGGRQTRFLTSLEEQRILQSEGESLIRSHWGSYILFLSNSDGDDLHVLRGPMSAIPCFWTEAEGVTIFVSRPTDVLEFGMASQGINWDLIRAQSVMGDYLCHETGLSGIFTLVSGDCLSVRRGKRSHRALWTPKSSMDIPSTPRLEAAAQSLRRITRGVIDCWVSQHPSVLVALSGGFDSSIVLRCVAAAYSKPTVRAINFHSRLSGDERVYARSMAALCAVPLMELQMPSHVDFTCFLNCAKTATPVLSFGGFVTEPIFSRLCAEFNASAVLTGELGDAVFGHAYGPELLAEALWRYGTTPRALGVIHRYAMLHRVSVWNAAAIALAEYRLHRRANCRGIHQRIRARTVTEQRSLATNESISTYERMQSRFIHPWLQDAATGPPGWLQTIFGMIMVTSTWSHPAFSGTEDSTLLAPLASQPVVEATLAIPADFHIAGSASAAVARRAFGHLLSAEVLGRGKAKGNPESWLSEVIGRNRPFLRELLLDGILVKERILDRRKTELALSSAFTRSKASVADLMVQLYIEAWLRRWMGDIK